MIVVSELVVKVNSLDDPPLQHMAIWRREQPVEGEWCRQLHRCQNAGFLASYRK